MKHSALQYTVLPNDLHETWSRSAEAHHPADSGRHLRSRIFTRDSGANRQIALADDRRDLTFKAFVQSTHGLQKDR